MSTHHISRFALFVLILVISASACAPASPTPARASGLRVVAVESFLADIAQNVAGDQIKIETLLPIGSDPHSFEPTPQDLRKLAESNVLIINGAGFEAFLGKLLENVGGERQVIEASSGLTSRELKPAEPHDEDALGDPHFWFDPTKTVKYVENIRDGLSLADPASADLYKTNAELYIQKLNALDAGIRQQLSAIPPANRKLVTDHDTFGYFADRYGFEIVGMLIPSFTTADSTTAQQLADLIDAVKRSGTRAIFIEQSMNPGIAKQVADETGAQVINGLYTHSLSEPNGPAPTYLQMLEYDARKIVEALR